MQNNHGIQFALFAAYASSRTAFQKWELEIKRGLFRFGLTSGDADLVATMVLSQLEGALLLARTYRSLAPIQRAEEAVKLLARAGSAPGCDRFAPVAARLRAG